LDEWRRR